MAEKLKFHQISLITVLLAELFLDSVNRGLDLQKYLRKCQKIQLLWPHGQKISKRRRPKKSYITVSDFEKNNHTLIMHSSQ